MAEALSSVRAKAPALASLPAPLASCAARGKDRALVSPGAADELADSIVDLLSDSAALQEMGRAGREFVQSKYEWGDVLTTWEETLAQARDRVSSMV